MKKFIRDFKAFALKGNVLDLAVGVMIGGAFGKIVTSLVNDLFMPLLSLLLGKVTISGAFYALDGQTYPSLEAANAAGVSTLNYGAFCANVIDFVLISLCVFLFVKLVARVFPAKPEVKPAPRLCPMCRMEVAAEAKRCPHCTSMLEEHASAG